MSTDDANLPVTDSKYVPAPGDYVGKLEPNFYCRAWNPRRRKYCRWRAGAGTDHKGMGRCRQHNGGADARMLHGLGSRIKHERFRDLVAHFQEMPNPLDITGEIALLRALVVDFVNRYNEEAVSHAAWWNLLEMKRQADEEARAMIDRLTEGMPRRRMLDITDAQKLVTAITHAAERMDAMANKNHISRANMYRIMGEMGRGVELANDEPDPQKRLDRIHDYWMSIAV